MKILIIGGYGVFGGRLAELLSGLPELELLIAGRSQARAQAFCDAYTGAAHVRAVALDRKEIRQALQAEQPDLVVDASGPFQDYGDDRYRVISACIDTGIDYLDFADAADFVFGVSEFDAAAKQADVFILSGVSSFPVLTAAVLRHMEQRMEIVSVEGGIAPSPYAGIGLNVMKAVIGYAGGPVRLHRNGQTAIASGLAESMRFTIAVPGRLPLRNTHFSLVDVPDLRVIPPEHSTLESIWMGAGPVPEFLHRILNLLAKARASFSLPSYVPLAPLFYRVLNLMRFGEHRGGMFVRAKGRENGIEAEQSWHLLAEGDDGPYIPSMAIEAIVRKLLNGERPESGARPATRALELSDYQPLFARRSIYTGFRHTPDRSAPIHRQILGSAFDTLPAKVQELHDHTGTRQWSGTATVRRGKGLIARNVAKLFGFPPESDQTPVHVTLATEKTGERWTRQFGNKTFSSFQQPGTGKGEHLLAERFGPISVDLALVIEGDRLYVLPRRWSCFGIPLPNFLLPDGKSFETEIDGQFCFDVEIAAPLIGLIVAYRGLLSPCESDKALAAA